MDNQTIFSLLVLLMMFCSFSAYFFVSILKSRIRIQLEKSNYKSGDVIKGKFVLNTKNESQSKKLRVGLVAKKKKVFKKNMVEIYRQEQDLEGEKSYPSRYSRTFDFEFMVPALSEAKDVSNRVMNLNVDDVSEFLSKGKISWEVFATLDGYGNKVSSNKNLNVKLSDLVVSN